MFRIKILAAFIASVGFLAYAGSKIPEGPKARMRDSLAETSWPFDKSLFEELESYGQNSQDQEDSSSEQLAQKRQLNRLDLFLQLLGEYKLNAPWITKDFMELSVQEFEVAWKEVMDILTKPERRWFYFCDKEEDFYEEDYWIKFLWQCNYFDSWLNQTYVDVTTHELLYKEEAAKVPERVVPIMQYWEFMSSTLKEGAELPYMQFYAFFIDCLSYFFCKAVDNAYQVIGDTANYNQSLQVAKKCLEKINLYLTKVKTGRLHVSYQLTVKKYQEILDLLEQERLIHMLGGLYV